MVDLDNFYAAISNQLAEELSRSLMKVRKETLKMGKIFDSCEVLFWNYKQWAKTAARCQF